jgi:hypothetical protein
MIIIMALINDKNWLKIIPNEIFRLIFKFCNRGTIMVMKYVTKDMATYITTNFPLDLEPQFDLCKYGAKNGYIDIIAWTLTMEENCKTNIIMIMHKYIGANCMVPFKFYYYEILLNNACCAAIMRLHIPMLEWIIDNEYKYNPNTWRKTMDYICAISASYGSIEILEWAKKIIPNRLNLGIVAHSAICSDNLDVIQWVIFNGYILDITAYMTLATIYHTKILVWLKDNDPNWNPILCSEAANIIGAHHIMDWLDTI